MHYVVYEIQIAWSFTVFDQYQSQSESSTAIVPIQQLVGGHC